MDVLIARDKKGLYSRALAGELSNVSGVDMRVDEPVAADVVVDNDGGIGLDEVVGDVMKQIERWDGT